MIGSSTSSSLAANASGGMGGAGGSGSQQLGTRQDNVSMGSSGQSYELIKSTQVRPIFNNSHFACIIQYDIIKIEFDM